MYFTNFIDFECIIYNIPREDVYQNHKHEFSFYFSADLNLYFLVISAMSTTEATEKIRSAEKEADLDRKIQEIRRRNELLEERHKVDHHSLIMTKYI